MDVKFLSGTRKEYTSLLPKVEGTFYYISDEKRLYLGEKELTTEAEVIAALAQVTTNKNDITKLKDEISTLIGSEGSKSIHDLIEEAVNNENTNYVGDKESLTTEAKTTIVDAINEVDKNADDAQKAADEAKAAAETAKTESTVTIEKTAPDGVIARYVIKQNNVAIANGTIDIPKDMVVKSGEVVDVTTEDIAEDGKYHGKVTETGKYILLTISNATEDQLFIKVDSLVDIYKAATDGAKTKEVKVAIDSSTREISATLTDGGVTESKLADGAVTANKLAADSVTENAIKDGAITKEKLAEGAVGAGAIEAGTLTEDKLSTDVQESLGKADTALQKSSITTGTDNGTIAVDGDDVAVAGLKGLAYKDETDLGLGDLAKTDKDTLVGELDKKYAISSELGDLAKKNETDFIETLNTKYDKAGAAQQAQEAAQTYVDTKLTWGTIAGE